ncbi:hypothetical protein EAX61_03540 [Dokdonia sinensis]|uniref:DUF4190 domain-containing protein n=1 Tax=Dokdonia sinensis TaxID=2479847 RepID=A0A3M0GP66_9FLAO|nr:CCC motif membrane protein [Dokdonia sinensis]RMB63473.1 hypothetical protein EAX61_03540 [Dokdonia sinensis]
MEDRKLPADPLATIGGILAIVIGVVGCCCYGITALIPLIIGIIGLVACNRSLREYRNNPEGYSSVSKSNINMAKVLNIIAIVFNGLIVLIFLIMFLVFGVASAASIYKVMEEGGFEGLEHIDDQSFEAEDYEDDYNYEENDEYSDEVDSLKFDTMIIEDVSIKKDTLY